MNQRRNSKMNVLMIIDFIWGFSGLPLYDMYVNVTFDANNVINHGIEMRFLIF